MNNIYWKRPTIMDLDDAWRHSEEIKLQFNSDRLEFMNTASNAEVEHISRIDAANEIDRKLAHPVFDDERDDIIDILCSAVKNVPLVMPIVMDYQDPERKAVVVYQSLEFDIGLKLDDSIPIIRLTSLREDEGGVPANNVGGGHIAGVGVGPNGEPGVDMKRRKRQLQIFKNIMKRRKPAL